MPAPTSTLDFVDLLRKSNLVEPARLDAHLIARPGEYASPKELARHLQADGLLTPFQTEQLLKGKYRGFFLGKYKLLDRIGMGGMGQVFLAEHGAMRRRVAVKVLPPDRAENQYSKERFLREARAVGQLDHPNLVRAFDVDADGDVIFLVMEFVDGVTFHDLVTKRGPLDPVRAAHYVMQAACGLDYLHQLGLVHRDIKPANLLVDRQGVVKLLDLGLVRSEAESNELTRAEGVKILGTADYLAPEQAVDCSTVDVRADLYGLGATGYFLVTGKAPFDEHKVASKLIAHQSKPVRPAHELNPAVPPGLSAVLDRLMAKRPQDRYQTPAELVAALATWTAAPPPPPTELEIPAVAGGLAGCPSSGVALSSRLINGRPGGGSAATQSTAGSRIRYQADTLSGLPARPASHFGPASGIRPAPAAVSAPTPMPAIGPPPLAPAVAFGGQPAPLPVSPRATTPLVQPAARPAPAPARAKWPAAVAAAVALAGVAAAAAYLTLPGKPPADPPAATAASR